MKDIGINFKEKREEIGISKDEICVDLGITKAQLDNLEDGNANAFKDIFFLREIVQKYAKYLNLDEEELMKEFNDFVFNYTSKIPVSEIEEKVKELKEEERENSPKKVISPYTKPIDDRSKRRVFLIYLFSIILTITLICLVVILLKRSLNM